MDFFDLLKISIKKNTPSKAPAAASPSKREIFLSTFRHQQEWSLPDSVIFYITKNPSSTKCYEKLIQTCKYFFIKNHILIVQRVDLDFENNKWNAEINKKQIDLKIITSRIWIGNELNFDNGHRVESKILSQIIPKIYKSDIKKLFLYDQNIFIHDLKFLISVCEKIRWTAVTVMDENGFLIHLEKIIEVLPKVKSFHYTFNFMGFPPTNVITSKTAAELLKIPHLPNLSHLILIEVPETFEIETFYTYIKKNDKTEIYLDFHDDISDAYKVRLQAIVDKMVEHKSPEFWVPMIKFPGIIESSREKMVELNERRC